MGKTLMGGASHSGNAQLLTPQQQQRFNSLLSALGGLGQQAYSDFLQPYSPQQYQDFYRQSFIEPAQQALKQDIVPALKESMLGLDESGSSDLNRALSRASVDLSSLLGQGILNQYNQSNANRLSALSGYSGLLGAKTFEPVISQSSGILGPLIGLGGQLGAPSLMRR